MVRSRVALLAVLGLAGLAPAVAGLSAQLDPGPVYTVAQVQAQLARRPGAWAGRTVRVSGRAVACAIRFERGYLRCVGEEPRLIDPDAGPASEPLPLVWGARDRLLTMVRRVPLLGGLLPAPQAVTWGAVATYRVGLQVIPGEPCAAACYEAVLLDAAPGSL
jgi:hypothetical protein